MSKVYPRKWVTLEGIRYLENAFNYVGKWEGRKCFIAPAAGEGGAGWALIMTGEAETLLALWYSPGEPDYVAEHDGDEDAFEDLTIAAYMTIEW